jgi:large subunit ribosomal protein L10
LAISRKKKEELVAQYVTLLTSSQVTIWADYSGLRVAALSGLRDQLRKYGVRIHVVKNTLLRRALEQVGLPMPEEYLEGPTAVIFLEETIAGPARIVTDFARSSREFEIKGGLTASTILAQAQVDELAHLQSRDVLLAQVLAGLQAPISGLVNVLAGTLRGLLYVLQARAEQLEGASS